MLVMFFFMRSCVEIIYWGLLAELAADYGIIGEVEGLGVVGIGDGDPDEDVDVEGVEGTDGLTGSGLVWVAVGVVGRFTEPPAVLVFLIVDTGSVFT